MVGDLNPFQSLVGKFGAPWLAMAYRLRYQYFVKERGWIKPSAPVGEYENDRYDEHAHHLAVYSAEHIITYLRVLPYDPNIGFMFDHEFADLLSDSLRASLVREGTVELSRLVVSKSVVRSDSQTRFSVASIHPIEYLLKALYLLAQEHDYNGFYIVVEKAWLRPFTRRFGLPFRVIGGPHTFPDGTETVLAMTTIQELEAGIRQHSAAKFEWYQSSDD